MSKNAPAPGAESWLTVLSLVLGVVNLSILAATVGRAAYERAVRKAWIDPLSGEVRPEVEDDARRYMGPKATEADPKLTAYALARETYVELGRNRPGPGDVREVNALVWPVLHRLAQESIANASA